MIAFFLYALTASIVLTAYEALHLFLPPMGLDPLSAKRGAIVLLLGALLSFWKRRAGAGVALLGAILIWAGCGSVANLGLHTFFPGYGGIGIVLLPAVALIVLFLTPTTIYALVLATGLNQHMDLPKWLFPEDPKFRQRAGTGTMRHHPRPDSVQLAAFLLYACWGIAAADILFSFRVSTLSFGYPLWILALTLLIGALWIVIEAARGRNWARTILLLAFLLRLPSFLQSLPLLYMRTVDFVIALLVFALQAVAMVLLFSKNSSAYFAQAR